MGVPKPAAPIAEPAPSLQGREEVKPMYDMMRVRDAGLLGGKGTSA